VGDPIPRVLRDPLSASQRRGQHLFFSANSDEVPITRNHWVACASCHIEGRSDAVTWRFAYGPRDTPTNAGGVGDTGFLLRTADRRSVRDYWQTIAMEQGGNVSPDDPASLPLLADLEAFVNTALPAPVPPATDPALVARGQAIFEDPKVGCAGCHVPPAYTDSGRGNPTLDLGGPILLHDVGTCDHGDFPDMPHMDIEGHARVACRFDTPSLRGVADSAPYLHDGSVATLRGVLERTRGVMGNIEGLSEDELGALVEFLRSL
jgi:cytochrome c peroxidase